MIFVSVTKNDGQAVIEISQFNRRSPAQFRRRIENYFPLTKRGCIAAGKWLAEIGAEDWSNNSSVDFPREVNPRFRYNVEDLMVEGFRLGRDMAQKTIRHSISSTVIGDYEIRGNQYVAIAINVKNPKDSHCFDIDPDVNNNAFVRACGWAYEPEN